MNNIELREKVHSAMYALIKKNGVASSVEILIEIGVLSKEDYENWRHGKVPYLERVCQINLSKLSAINREIRAFARKNNLKESWTYYKQWGQNKKGNKKTIKLRFSKGGDENIERQYATHYVVQRKVEEANHGRTRRNPTQKNNTGRFYLQPPERFRFQGNVSGAFLFSGENRRAAG